MNAVSGASGYMAPKSSEADTAVIALRSTIKQNTQDFKALRNALASNNVKLAAEAFANLQSDIQKASIAAGGKSPFDSKSPIAAKLQAVGKSLSEGDLAGAQESFAAFRQEMRSAGRVAYRHSQSNVENGAPSSSQPSLPLISPGGIDASA